jgi:sugar lactone lactonase YvrE
MTRRISQVRRQSATRDPYGLVRVAGYRGPLIAGLGLLLVAWLSFGLLTGGLATPGVSGGTGNNNPGVQRTPTPSGVIHVPASPEIKWQGSIVYAKDGNIWIQTSDGPRQLTKSGADSMPSWSPDGQYIYYIETDHEVLVSPYKGNRRYGSDIPLLMRIKADGSGKPQQLATGKYRTGGYWFYYWLRQPVLSPDGRTIALLSDAPDALQNDVVLQFFDLKTRKLRNPRVPETSPLGHQDPAWRSDGQVLLYVKNGKDGSRGAPVIYRYDPKTKSNRPLSGPGYENPAWSRDGKYVAATSTDSFGTDIVILDGRKGTELLRVTNDGASWGPAWSPFGDAIAFLHLQDGVVDLRLAHLDGNSGRWTVGKVEDLTESAGLDSQSHPGWFVPADQLPALATPTPATPSAAPSSSAP